jgi:hypothetical protein
MNLDALDRLESFILHVNHASLLIKYKDCYLLTDPWIISPAFGSWIQSPSPSYQVIDFICQIPREKLALLISHGHDDHLDDYFIKANFQQCTVFHSKFRSPGLSNRLAKLLDGKQPVGVDSNWIEWGGFKISSYVNHEFTNNDAINIVTTEDFVVVHANDNWHKQPSDIIDTLMSVKTENINKPFYYFSQIGIADCFANSYPQYSHDEKKGISTARIDHVIDAAVSNTELLGIKQLYSYANQSQIDNALVQPDINNYSITQNKIKNITSSHLKIDQLNPGSFLIPGSYSLNNLSMDFIKDALFDRLLKNFEVATNQFLQKTSVNGTIHFSTVTDSQMQAFKETVVYTTSKYNWQNILIGQINLEAITIGGIGFIYKQNPNESIRDIHNAISKFAYIAQNNFLSKGYNWLD